MNSNSVINLNAIVFDQAEKLLVRHSALKVFAFRYASGVAALHIINSVGEIIFLPFHGQQIWDAKFYGRRLTMRSMFDDPVNTQDYLGNYGAFLVHCGATAMGNPGPGDKHALHGELPNALYQKAEIICGTDEEGAFIELAGSYRHTVAFTHNYLAEPKIRLGENDGRMQMKLKVTNLKASPMDVMYLAHVNFKPVDGAKLIDTASDNPSKTYVRDKFPEFFKPTERHLSFINDLKQNPKRHRDIETGRPIDPELVMGLNFAPDKDGWAHSMQILPDGSSDFISHRPQQLPKGVRWMTRTADQDALGLYLPGTAQADGYTAEKAKGNVLSVAAGQYFECELAFGALDAATTLKMKKQIEAI